jgi:hypothetical protein
VTEDSGGNRLPVPSEISREQLEKVIHRAAELQFGQGDKPDSLEAEEVLRIA